MPRDTPSPGTARCPSEGRIFSPPQQTPAAQSSSAVRPPAPASRQNSHLQPRLQLRRFSAILLHHSSADHLNQPIDILRRVIQVRGNSNVAFAQTSDHLLSL